ncbi:Glycosyl transferase family protein [Flavobacterium anhuiense]|uniref:Glycosyl transferase family protein n=1 Tax=Flavobacterium anhuiense TaxID=459526 RepID=A0A444VUB4_9FLAO|nr:glycosyltransferase family 2 protein [Flavobacterium anhuiense]RYJ37033.1 Glycosyl transferase family protein [Flavobacterium anhuiense]
MNSEKQKLSVLIITLNEEQHIKSLLEDLDFADEIIVVDSYSTDKTIGIIESFTNVKLIQNHFVNYTSQRNFALDQAKNQWVLFIDADERLTPELKSEIIATFNSKKTASAYFIYRIFMFEDSRLNFSGWQTDKIFRLFDKSKCRYNEERTVHEKLIVKGPIASLKNKIIHFSYSSYEDYKAKMRNYGILKANEKFSKGIRPYFSMLFLHPLYTFLYQFIMRFGFLDGRKGIIVCYLNAYSVYIRYKELRRITSSRI